MIVDYIKEILTNYRNGISLEKLNEILNENLNNSNLEEIISHSKLFSTFNGIVFQKKTLFEYKDSFFAEFEDYIKTKIIEPESRKGIIENLKYFIPDSILAEWLNISLERKLLIFDFIFSFFIKPKRVKDKFKIFTAKVLDYYILVSVYSILVIQTYDKDYSKPLNLIKKLESCEEILKTQLFNILTIPDVVKATLDHWEREFNDNEKNLRLILDKSFSLVSNYSPRILKRVIEREIKTFQPSYIFSRFESNSFYEWLLILTEEKETFYRHSIFDDLGLG
jgi:hypothetical protein